MKTKLTLFVAVLAVALFGMGCASTDNVSPVEIPYNGEFKGHKYLVIHSAKNFTYVEAQALAFALGGHLPYVESEEENNFILRLVSDERYWTSINKEVARIPLGATDKKEEGKWFWNDGQPLTWTNWRAGHPNNVANQDQMEIIPPCHPVKDHHGKWEDADDVRRSYHTIVIELE
jgi:hypothetical protein